MASWPTGVVLLLVLLVPCAAAMFFRYCDKKTERLEKRVHSETCYYFSGDRTSTVTWKLVPDTGRETILGVCHDIQNCTAGPDVTNLGRYSSRSYIGINMTLEMSGTLVCQVTHSNGDMDAINCSITVKSISLSQCDEAGFMKVNNSSPLIEASLSMDTPSTVSWTLVSPNGQETDLGTCTDISSCVSPLSPYVTVERTSLSYSRLRIRNIRPETAGTVMVTERHRGTVDRVNCSLDVVDPPELECSLEMYRENWTFVGSCNVSEAFSALGRYRYGFYQRRDCIRDDWRCEYWQMIVGRYSQFQLVFDNLRPFYPSPYTDNSTGTEQYYRGTYTDTWPVSGKNGSYFFESRTLGSRHSFLQYRRFHVELPHHPTHNCTDLKFIPERGEVSCTCRTTFTGDPAGRLIWFSGDTALATGDYGAKHLTFSSALRNRNSDGLPLFCYLDWPVGYKTSVTSHIAYGPDEVDVQYWNVLDPSGATTVVVYCKVIGVNPLTIDMITWDGSCQGQKGFTCTLRMPEVDAKVTCTVTNAANNGHAVAGSVYINGLSSGRSKASANSDLAKGIGVGVGVVVLLLVLVAAVTLLVLWRRGTLQRCCNPIYDRPSKRRKKQEEESRAYTDLDLAVHVISGSAPRTGSTSEVTRTETQAGEVYQNVEYLA